MKFANIKNLTSRRVLMCTLGPLFVFQYMYLGLRSMYYEFKWCWNYQPEETPNV